MDQETKRERKNKKLSAEAIKIIDAVNGGITNAGNLRNELALKTITETELLENTDLNQAIIDRVKIFPGSEDDDINNNNAREVKIPDFDRLPRMQEGTDIYFLGMPSSGKSCMLASVLSHCNNTGSGFLKDYNPDGEDYYRKLVIDFKQGILPKSTQSNFINYIPLDLVETGNNNHKTHPVNFIDISGEKFNAAAEEGVNGFDKLIDFLKNKNRKTLIFIADFNREKDNAYKTHDQSVDLPKVLTNLTNDKDPKKLNIINEIDNIYLMIAKSDKFDNEAQMANKTIAQFAEEFATTKYRTLYEQCRRYEGRGIQFKVLPYAIGPVILKNLLVDFNPATNKYLNEYPEMLLQNIISDTFYKNESESIVDFFKDMFKM